MSNKETNFLARSLHVLPLCLYRSSSHPHQPSKFLFRLHSQALSFGKLLSAQGSRTGPFHDAYSSQKPQLPFPPLDCELFRGKCRIRSHRFHIPRYHPTTAILGAQLLQKGLCCSFVSPAVPYIVCHTAISQ